VSAGPVTETVNESEEGLDWIAVGLGFLAVLAVVGLIPLYVWIYLVYTR
jgi:hypothetical protein